MKKGIRYDFLWDIAVGSTLAILPTITIYLALLATDFLNLKTENRNQLLVVYCMLLLLHGIIGIHSHNIFRYDLHKVKKVNAVLIILPAVMTTLWILYGPKISLTGGETRKIYLGAVQSELFFVCSWVSVCCFLVRSQAAGRRAKPLRRR